MSQLVVGWREWVALPELLPSDPINAKIDTGARTSALHAWDISSRTVNGEVWLDFSLHPRQRNDDYVVRASARQVDEREVRSSNGELEARPVISTDLVLGSQCFPIELTLTGRHEMAFRMLLGRSALARRCVVDPAASHLLGSGGSAG